MAVVCNTREYIIEHVPAAPPQYFRYWDKVDKVVRVGVFSAVTDYYTLNYGSIIDCIEQGGKVKLVTYALAVDSVAYTVLSSTSGDTNNTLVSATVSGGLLTVVMWARTAREITTLTYPMQVFTSASPAVAITPCFNDFFLAEGTIVSQWCDEFTLNQVIVTQSPHGASIVTTENSELCGYSPPTGIFRISEEKTVEFRKCIYRNPVFFIWKNTLGGWDSYLFERTQTENMETESLGSFVSDYTRIGDVNNPQQEIGKNARGRTVFTASNISLQEKIGLKQLLISNKVYIWKDGVIDREVSIIPGTFLIQETKNTLHDISFEILDVQINTIKN